MKIFIERIHGLITVSTALIVLTGLLSRYISPEIFWWLAPFGLLFPFAFLVLTICLIIHLLFFRKKIILTILVFVVAFPVARMYLTWSASRRLQDVQKTNTLTITSFNSMLFDLYNWFENHKTRPKILRSLRILHPDILCLQEFYTSEKPGDFNNVDSIVKLFHLPYHHVEYKVTLRNTDHWGIATFSRYPVIRTGKLDFQTSSNNLCIYSDIVLEKDTIRIYNFHLQSYGISAYLQNNNKQYQKKNFYEKIRLWLNRFRYGYKERARQADLVYAHIASCRYPVIICGDLNDVPCSYAYRKLRGDFLDAFVVEGFGLGRTYSGKAPRFRIDYIFYSPEWKCVEYFKSKYTYTDHYPITAVFEKTLEKK